MPSTYSNNLRLELIGSGEQSGAWGNTTNNNLGTLIEEAISGVGTITITDADYILKAYNGVSDEARQPVLIIGGTLSVDRKITAPAKEKLYVIKNNTVGGKALLLQTTDPSTVPLTIPNGSTYTVYCSDSVSFTQYGGLLNHYNNQTGDVFGISNVNAGIGIGIANDSIVGSVTATNTGVLTFNGLSGNVVATKTTITDLLGYIPPTPDGTGVTSGSNWDVNAATATKLASSTGVAPSYATRAWVNYNQKAAASPAPYTKTASAVQLAGSTVVNVTGLTGLTTISGTYRQSTPIKTGTYVQGTTLAGSATYVQGGTPTSGATYTQTGYTVSVFLATALPTLLLVGQQIRVTIGASVVLRTVATVTDTLHFTFISDTSTTIVTPTSIVIQTAGNIVTATYASHGVGAGAANITVTSGAATSGGVTVTGSTTNTFTYTASNNLLTSGNMTVTKPSTSVTATSIAHGLAAGTTSIYVTTASPVSTTYTATRTGVDTFTFTAAAPALTAYNTPGTISFVYAGTTVTVTATAHGLIAGESVWLNNPTASPVSQVYQILSVPTANTFTYIAASSVLIYATPSAVTFVNDGFSAGQMVTMNYPLGTTTYVSFVIQTVTGLNSFTVAYTAGAHSVGVTFRFLAMRGDGNVAYVSDGANASVLGYSYVNFRAPMISANYCLTGTGSDASTYVNITAATPTNYGAGGALNVSNIPAPMYIPIRTVNGAGTGVDSEYTYISITQ